MDRNIQLPRPGEGIVWQGLGNTVNFFTQVTPITKMLFFYPMAAIALIFIGYFQFLALLTLAYATIIPILIAFFPNRTWSEETYLQVLKFIGDKKNPLEAIDAEPSRPENAAKKIKKLSSVRTKK